MKDEETKSRARQCHRLAIDHLPDIIKSSSKVVTGESVLSGHRFRIHTRLTSQQGADIGEVETNANLQTGELRPSLIRYEYLP